MTLGSETPATERSGRVVAARWLTKRSRRTEEKAFLAEGPQAVAEAVRFHRSSHPQGIEVYVRRIFVDGEVLDRLHETLDHAQRRGIHITVCTSKAIGVLADTVSPQGIVADCRMLDVPLEQVLEQTPSLLAVPVDVRDPGNAGTIIRCADAAGADGVVVAGDSVDIYNSKVVRASVGSLFHVRIARTDSPVQTVRELQSAGLTVVATEGSADTDLDEFIDGGGLDGRTAWLFGNEAHGLAPEVAAAADHRIRIPIGGLAESLNLSTAAAVCLFASARAHRAAARSL